METFSRWNIKGPTRGSVIIITDSKGNGHLMNLWWFDILYKLYFQENFQFKIQQKNLTRFHVAYLDMHSLLNSRLLYSKKLQDLFAWVLV